MPDPANKLRLLKGGSSSRASPARTSMLTLGGEAAIIRHRSDAGLAFAERPIHLVPISGGAPLARKLGRMLIFAGRFLTMARRIRLFRGWKFEDRVINRNVGF